MKIYVVLKTVATNDGVVTKALRAFKTEKEACSFIDEQNIDESEPSPSVSLLDYQEVDLEKEVREYISKNGTSLEEPDEFLTTLMQLDDMVMFAKHFYELGLKAKE